MQSYQLCHIDSIYKTYPPLILCPLIFLLRILLSFVPTVINFIMILCCCESGGGGGSVVAVELVPQRVNRRRSFSALMLTLDDIVLVRLASNIIRYRCNGNILIFRKSSLIRYICLIITTHNDLHINSTGLYKVLIYLILCEYLFCPNVMLFCHINYSSW